MGFFGIGRNNKNTITLGANRDERKKCSVHNIELTQEFLDDDFEKMGPCRDVCLLCENTETREVLFEKHNLKIAIRQASGRIHKIWRKSGLLDGLNEAKRTNITLLLESQAEQKII